MRISLWQLGEWHKTVFKEGFKRIHQKKEKNDTAPSFGDASGVKDFS